MNKQFIIDTLLKLVDSSPIKKTFPGNLYNGNAQYNISQQELDIWVKYVNSILDLLSDYIAPAEINITKMQINNLATQDSRLCALRTLDIERVLLNLARSVLTYYV